MSSRVLAAFRQPHPLTEPYGRFSRIRLFIAVPLEKKGDGAFECCSVEWITV